MTEETYPTFPSAQDRSDAYENNKTMIRLLERGVFGSMKEYTPEMVGSGQRGVCAKCKRPPTREGHDGCLGTLKGDIMNACCGHGNNRQAYIQYWGGKHIEGEAAIAEQKRLIKLEGEQK